MPYYAPLPGLPHAPASMWARAVTESALDRNHYAYTAVPLQMPQNEMVPLRMGVC
jgi:hypothetical protein